MAVNRFKALARAMPALDSAAAARAAESARIQAAQGAAAAGPGAGIRQAQAIAPAVTQAVAAPALTAAQQGVQAQGQLGQAALEATAKTQAAAQQLGALEQGEALAGEARTAQAGAAGAARSLGTELTAAELASGARTQAAELSTAEALGLVSRRQAEDLSRLGSDVKLQLLDNQLKFDSDEAGRKFSNERQLLDYTAASAKSAEDFASKLQLMEQTFQRAAAVESRVYDLAAGRVKQEYDRAAQAGDQARMAELARLDQWLAKSKADAEHAAFNRSLPFQAAGAGIGIAAAAFSGG